MESVLRQAVNMDLIDGPYVEYSKVEVPKSIKNAIFNEHLSICPKNADISDDEIQEMINETRCEKKYL